MLFKNKMSRYSITPDKILRWMAEGRGTGEGPAYKPQLTVHDVPSKGLRFRAWSVKQRRTIHLLSRLEFNFFLLLGHNSDVLDFREQFPLGLEITKRIAQQLRISHPWNRKTGCLVPMTTDFLYRKIVDGRPRLYARNLKYRRDLAERRTIEKLAIEKAVWDEQPGVDFGIVTEREIPSTLIRNLEWLHDALRADYLAGLEEVVPKVEAYLRPRVLAEDTALADLTSTADSTFGLEPGSSLAIAKWLLAHRHWRVDLARPITPLVPLHLEEPPHAPVSV